MSFEKMVETYSRTSRTKNSDPSLFFTQSLIQYWNFAQTPTQTHPHTSKYKPTLSFFFFVFFFLKLNFHSFIQSKRTKTVQSLKKIENRGRYRRKHQTHFIYQNIMPKLKIKIHTPTPTHIQTQLELLFLSQS